MAIVIFLITQDYSMLKWSMRASYHIPSSSQTFNINKFNSSVSNQFSSPVPCAYAHMRKLRGNAHRCHTSRG